MGSSSPNRAENSKKYLSCHQRVFHCSWPGLSPGLTWMSCWKLGSLVNGSMGYNPKEYPMKISSWNNPVIRSPLILTFGDISYLYFSMISYGYQPIPGHPIPSLDGIPRDEMMRSTFSQSQFQAISWSMFCGVGARPGRTRPVSPIKALLNLGNP